MDSISISISVSEGNIEGDLSLPAGTNRLVVFAHGSGSSRHSARNRFVANFFNEAGLGTLLVDLLTTEEESADRISGQLRFDIPLLADRLIAATDWARENPTTRTLEIGYFGASTGAAASLIAASEIPEAVGAVVSRGGRPDLAGHALESVTAPTLLIVGSLDTEVLELNEFALRRLAAKEKRLETLTGATHLFEEPGALAKVARLARDWFTTYLEDNGVSHRRASQEHRDTGL